MAAQIHQIAFGIAAGVLMDTFLVRTLLVPTMVVLLGRWNWWPSPLFKRTVALERQDEAAPPVPELALERASIGTVPAEQE